MLRPLQLLRHALRAGSLASVLAAGAAPSVLEARVAAELTRAGLPDARFQLDAVGWDRLVLRDVELAPDLSADRVEIGFDPSALVRDGRIDSVAIEGAEWELDLAHVEDGTIARLARSGGGPGGGAPISEVRVTGSRIVVAGHTIELAGEVRLDEGRATIEALSELGAHDVIVRSEHGRIAVSARTRSGEDAIDLVIDPEARSVAIDLDSRVPAAFLPEIELGGRDPRVAATGVLRQADGALAGDLALAIDSAGARLPGLALDDVHARARAHVEIGTSIAIEVWGGDVRAARIAAGDLVIEEVAALGGAAITIEDGAIRVLERGAIAAEVGSLAIGGASGVRLDRTSIELAGRDGVLLERGALRGEVRARADRMGGAVSARALRADGRIEIDLATGEVRGEARATAPRVVHAESDVVVSSPDVTVSLTTDRRGRVSARGRGRAGDVSWRSVAIGPALAHLGLSRERLWIDATGRATADAPFALAVRVGLAHGGGSVHVGVPASEVSAGDPLHRLLAELAGVRIAGRAGGQVDVDLRRAGAGSARLALEGAAIELVDGTGSARGVRGEIALGGLDPVLSTAPSSVTWDELDALGVVRTGAGSAQLAFAEDGAIEIDRLRASVGGGTMTAAPFRVDLESKETVLAVELDDVQLGALASAVSSGRLEASGRLDGRLALELRTEGGQPRVVLGDGHLRAIAPGRIRVIGDPRAPVDVRDPRRIASVLGERVLAALSDFEYSRLAIELERGDGTEPTRAQARVAGRGSRTPQEIDLTMRVRGVQELLDEVLRLWPSKRPSSPASSPASTSHQRGTLT